MNRILNAESFYLRLDPIFRTITLMTAATAGTSAIFIGRLDHFDNPTVLYGLGTLKSMSIFLFFLFPVYFCFFSTEGFESGSVKILMANLSVKKYILSKFTFIVLIIFLWMTILLGFYFAVYTLGSAVTGSLKLSDTFFSIHLDEILSWLSVMLLIISVSSIITSLGLVVKKLSNAAFLTFFIVMIDFMFNGYFKDSQNDFAGFLATHTFSASIMKVSGSYIVRGELIKVRNYFPFIMAAMVIILISLAVTILNYTIRDVD